MHTGCASLTMCHVIVDNVMIKNTLTTKNVLPALTRVEGEVDQESVWLTPKKPDDQNEKVKQNNEIVRKICTRTDDQFEVSVILTRATMLS